MNDFYVYAWRRPDTGDIFYIGKGRGKRARSFNGRSDLFMRVVAKVRRLGLEPEITFIAKGLTESEAFSIEKRSILEYGRRDTGCGPLVNMTDGGDGASGLILTEDHKARIASSKIGKPRPEWLKERLRELKLGVPLSPGHRANISAAQVGSKHSEEAKAKIGLAHKGKTLTADHIERMVAKLKGRKLPPEHVENMRAAVTKRFEDPAEREKSATASHLIPAYKNNTSGYKGVSFRKDKNKWRATIKLDGRQKSLGVFLTAQEAAKAYDDAAYGAWGVACYLNFPDRYRAANDNETHTERPAAAGEH